MKVHIALIAMLALAAPAVAQTTVPPFIAGVHPDQRPAGAPKITDYPKDADWYAKALTGVEQPYPASLRFLEDQGAWYTPFTRPGMTGRYDIRGWHKR